MSTVDSTRRNTCKSDATLVIHQCSPIITLTNWRPSCVKDVPCRLNYKIMYKYLQPRSTNIHALTTTKAVLY